MQVFNRSSKVRDRTPQSRPRSPNVAQFLLNVAENGHNALGSVIAFTSANSGEGVSHVTRMLAGQLATQTARPTVIVDAAQLSGPCAEDFLNLPASCGRTNLSNLWVLRKKRSSNGNGNGNGSKPFTQSEIFEADFGTDRLQKLRTAFAHTLIDCPSIATSHETAALAPNVDGVVLIVEAGRTKRDQILRARQTIEMANGKLMALVLNKSRHVVPEWLYRML